MSFSSGLCTFIKRSSLFTLAVVIALAVLPRDMRGQMLEPLFDSLDQLMNHLDGKHNQKNLGLACMLRCRSIVLALSFLFLLFFSLIVFIRTSGARRINYLQFLFFRIGIEHC